MYLYISEFSSMYTMVTRKICPEFFLSLVFDHVKVEGNLWTNFEALKGSLIHE